jgi:hypothetical protein
MDYLQFSHAVLTVIAPFSPLFYGLGLLTLLAAAFFTYQRYRKKPFSPKALLPASVKPITKEAPTLDDVDDAFENISYNDALLLLDMFKADVTIRKQNKRGKAQQLNLNGLSAAQMKEILSDANKIEAIARRHLHIDVTGDRHHYCIPGSGTIV